MEPARWFAEGGLFMYLVVLSGLVGIVVVGLQFILVKKAAMWPIVGGSVIGTVMLGMLGTVVGMMQAFSALAQAAPEQKAALLAAGASIAMTTTAFSLIVAGIILLLGSIAVTVRESVKGRG